MEKLRSLKLFTFLVALSVVLQLFFSPVTTVFAADSTSEPIVTTTETEVVSSEVVTEEKQVTTTAEPISAVEVQSEATSEVSDVTSVEILHTNDMHGRLQYEEYKGKATSFGMARAKSVIDSERASDVNKTVFVLDAGDAFQGLPISNESKGEDMAKAMNAVGYDAMTAGNHEFDFGFGIAKGYDSNWLNFPMVTSNVYKDGKLVYDPYTIVEKKGIKMGVIGVTTPETYTKTNPVGIVGVEFKAPIPSVMKQIDTIKDKVDFITILSHLGDDTTTKPEETGTGLAQALANHVDYNNLAITVIDGHSHQVVQKNIAPNIHLVQTGAYLANIGKITFDYNKQNKQVTNYQTTILSAKEVAKNYQPDPEIQAIVDEAQRKFDVKGKEFLFNNKVTLAGESKYVRTKETNLGNAIADALEDYSGFTHPSDFAVTNGGGIRTTLNKDSQITLGDVIKVLPFGNQLMQIKVSGKNVKDMYEHALRALQDKQEDGTLVLDEQGKPQLGSNGGFLHSSKSIKVYFDVNKEPGQRVWKIEMFNRLTNQFEPLNLTKDYYMATNDFLAVGGDGYTMLGGVREESGLSMDRQVADYLKKADMSLYNKEFPYSRIIPLAAVMEIPMPKLPPVVQNDKTITETNKVAIQKNIQPTIKNVAFEHKTKKVSHLNVEEKQLNENSKTTLLVNEKAVIAADKVISNDNVTISSSKNKKVLPATGEVPSSALLIEGLLMMLLTSVLITRIYNNKM